MKPLNSSKPHVIVMVGIPGSGKSYFAEHFADTFKSPLISSDRLRSLLQSASVNDDTITVATNYLLDEVTKTGRTVVYDGAAGSRSERASITKKLRDVGYEPLFVWVQTEPSTAKKRAIKSNASEEQFQTKLKRFSPPHVTEHAVVISGKHAYNSQLKIVLKHLVEPRVTIVERTVASSPVRTSGGRGTLIR